MFMLKRIILSVLLLVSLVVFTGCGEERADVAKMTPQFFTVGEDIVNKILNAHNFIKNQEIERINGKVVEVFQFVSKDNMLYYKNGDEGLWFADKTDNGNRCIVRCFMVDKDQTLFKRVKSNFTKAKSESHIAVRGIVKAWYDEEENIIFIDLLDSKVVHYFSDYSGAFGTLKTSDNDSISKYILNIKDEQFF